MLAKVLLRGRSEDVNREIEQIEILRPSGVQESCLFVEFGESVSWAELEPEQLNVKAKVLEARRPRN